jgi:hypothetical protein
MNKCSTSQCDCSPDIARRDFLHLAGLLAAGTTLPGMMAMAGPFRKEDFEKWVPLDKKLDPDWVKSLFARGEPTVYRNAELDHIGMPIGGICAGQLYLGGDGKLLHWDVFKEGSWYAMPGEGGTIMTTWPHGDRQLPKVVAGDMAVGVGYLNTCMAGYEHQVAGHMISEGLVLEGLAVERAIHDRYHASRRNPWNEVECGDHYSRGMASYGLLIAASGFGRGF